MLSNAEVRSKLRVANLKSYKVDEKCKLSLNCISIIAAFGVPNPLPG